MSSAVPLYNFAPVVTVVAVGALLSLVPLAWVWLRHRHAGPAAWLRALTVATLFLTFDLVVFGAFTRLTDSGLGCPDWPGCYGSASPLGAQADIHAAQSAMPTGPVTHGKAWIEMIHRYLATGVGALITVLMVASAGFAWRGRARADDRAQRSARDQVALPWWPALTFVWVCAQGAFGALTVTMKLYPAIVTLHLLGGVGLLVLLAVQREAHAPQPLALSAPVRRLAWWVAGLTVMQIGLGGWVSTNYAVLACSDFPACQGQWWPTMDWAQGFALRRHLGLTVDGTALPFAALTAIHMGHRLGAAVLLSAIAALLVMLARSPVPGARRWAAWLGVVVLCQVATGLGNVLLGWPLLAALGHTAGAALLLTLLAMLLARARHTAPAAVASSIHRVI